MTADTSVHGGTPELPGLTPQELDVLKKVFSSPMDIPQEWKTWLVSYIEANPPVLPIGQIFGFAGFTANYSEVVTTESFPGPIDTFVDLATVGPEVTVGPGRYVLFFGCNYDASGGATGCYAPSVNGAAAQYSEGAVIEPVSVQRFNLARALIKDVAGDSNTIVMKYYSSQTPGPTFKNRWLVAFKYANL